MFKALFGKTVNKDLAHALYGAVVARSRDGRFYSQYGVPDNLDGRFELLVMHLYLLLERLQRESREYRQISQQVFDAFIDDMDSALRELGVGDQTVPKKIARMTQVFYGRTRAYRNAWMGDDVPGALQVVIDRNMFPDGDSGGNAFALAQYMADQAEELARLSADRLTRHAEIYRRSPADRVSHAD